MSDPTKIIETWLTENRWRILEDPPKVGKELSEIMRALAAQAWDEGVEAADDAADKCCGCSLAPKVGPNPYRKKS